MASLNTLRTKYGIVLSVGIAVVLLAFVLGDILPKMGSDNQENKNETVLKIGNKTIDQLDYYTYTQKYGVEGMAPDQNAAYIYQQILFNEYLNPAYEAAGMGFVASDEETLLHSYAKNYIATTPGASAMSTADLKKEIDANWNYMKYGMYSGNFAPMVATQKAAAAYTAGKYTNKLEVEEALRNENLSFDGHYVMLPFSAIECEAATEAEIEAYYNAHRVENHNYGARTLSYVRFNIEPSAADEANAEAAIMDADLKAKEAVAANDTKAIKNAVRNVNGKIENYVALSSLSEEEVKALNAEKSYGPVLSNDVWTAKYLVAKVNAPESYTFNVITTETNAEAEALVANIEAVNGNLAELEAGANATTKTVNMVDLNERGAEKLLNVKVGDIFTYVFDNQPAAVVVTELGKNADFVITANVNYAVVASPETYTEITTKADKLMKECGNTPESFTAAVQEIGMFAMPTTVVRSADPGMARPSVAGIEDSRNIAVWAYDAEVGQKKSWTSKNVAYVAMITKIDNEQYMAKNESMIKRSVENEKKFKAAKETLTMNSTDEKVKSGKFEGVTFSTEFVDGTYEPAVAAAISRIYTEGNQPVVVKGNSGVYLFVVDKINNNDAVVNADVEAKRKMMNEAVKAETTRNFNDYMMECVKVVDNRGAGEL